MLVVGLTGSIGMGKSTVAARFRRHGISVFDADAEVHRLYEGPAARLVEQEFPGTTADGTVDRTKLASALNADTGGFKRLEAIVHPMVWQAERKFLQGAQETGERLAVLEIPLLFEAGSDNKMDAIIVASASADDQRRRVMERPGMTEARLSMLLERQLSNAEKRRRADYVVDTSVSLSETHAQIDQIILKLRERPATAYNRHWT